MNGPRKDFAARFANGNYEWLAVDATADRAPSAVSASMPPVRRETIAFLQYTSGSTSIRRASWSPTTIC